MEEPRTSLVEMVDKIEQLGQFQDRIDSPATVGQIWEAFLEDIRHLIDIDTCALFLVEDRTQEFVLAHAFPATKAATCRKEIEHQIEYGIFPWILKRRQPALVPAFAFGHEKSIVMLPLATVRRTLGMVLAHTPIQDSLITRENLKLLGVLARQCSLVIENTLLYERLRIKKESLENANKEILYLSQRDSLTGCYNRGYLNEHLPKELKRARRYQHAFAVAMCDLDHFKRVNDTHGHQCGDKVLKHFVKCIHQIIRTDADWLARYGGEEFLLVLPETTVENAHRLSERLRKMIAKMTVPYRRQQIAITASFGVAGFDPRALRAVPSPEALINAADEYLYQAKESGRNTVVSGLLTVLEEA